jgi:hypothetical protein
MNNTEERNRIMAKVSLDALSSIDGFMVGALVDMGSGLALATLGNALDLDLAAAGNSEVLKAKRKVAGALKLNDTIEDLLITLNRQYHLLRPLERNADLFFVCSSRPRQGQFGDGTPRTQTL